MANGYNPLRWDCEHSGCYNVKLRPKIEMFADCFPGAIAMGDVDATVEIGGHFLFLEWKADKSGLGTGQRIYFEKLTKLSRCVTAIIVRGDPKTMDIEAYQVIHNGKLGSWQSTTLKDFKLRLSDWATRVRGNYND